MLEGKALEEAIASKPYPKVTKEYIESRVSSHRFIFVGDTVTICHLELDNGYSVRGESACVDPRNFDIEIGKGLAYKNAFAKLWPLFGFLLAEANFNNTLPPKPEEVK